MGNRKWACFDCRTTYNREHSVCPKCGGKMRFMGLYFKPPKRSKDKEWQAIETLIDAGVIYNHSPVGERPRQPREVEKYLEDEAVQQWIRYWQSKQSDS